MSADYQTRIVTLTNFPRVELASRVDPADQASAIEFVNRVNWLFETWDVEGMMQAFTPDSVIYHFLGTVRTPEEKKHFVESVYPYLIPGVSRHATNHIVDVDGDGVSVRYHDLSIRYAEVDKAPNLGDGEEQESDIGLPALWTYSPVLDRLRRVDGQWRIAERHIGGSMTDSRFSPPTKDAQALSPFMPQAPSSRDTITS